MSDNSGADVVYGEALLTLEPASRNGGFTVRSVEICPLLLLDPCTFVADESLLGSAAFLGRALAHPETLPRLARIWQTFRRYRDHLGAVTLVATKTATVVSG